jgi:hypothetical protein
MGACIYCGRPTGSSETRHPECERQHALGMTQIRDAFLLKAIHAVTPPAEVKTLIEGIARTHFVGDIELRALTISGLKSMVDSAVKQNETDTDYIAPLLKEFGVTTNDLGPNGFKFIKMQILHALDKGRILGGVTLEGTDILLEPGEKPIWKSQAKHTTTDTRTSTRYVGGSQGISVRLMKGLWYRTGSYRGRPIETESVSHEREFGTLLIASRNVYFQSGQKVAKIPIKKILSVHRISNGIEITQDAKKAEPETFEELSDPSFAADAITRLHQIPSVAGSHLSPEDSSLAQLIAGDALDPQHNSGLKANRGGFLSAFLAAFLDAFLKEWRERSRS